MQIALYLGDQQITASNVEVRVNPDDEARARALVERTRNDVPDVNDAQDFEDARQAAAQIKGMLDDIELSRKQAKGPFISVERAIDGLARKVAGPLKSEQERILAMLNRHVAELEAARKMQERLEAEAKRIAQEEADRKVREAQEARDYAQEQLRKAETEIEKANARIVAQRRENQLLQEQLARELQADVQELDEPEAPRGLVPGGRVDHLYEFELVDVAATVKAGCWRLVKWTLDIMACRDSVKSQVEMLPPDQEPTLPGIKITKKLNVSVKAASRIK